MDIYINKYNVGATVEGVTLITRGALDFKSTPTLAVGDVKVSKDGGTFNNIAILPTVTPATDTSVQIVLSATEMSAKEIIVRFIDQTGPKEWEDYALKLRTYGHASAFYPGDLDLIDAIKAKTDQLLFDSYGDVLATQNYVAGAVATDITNGASQFKTTLGSATNEFYTGGWLLPTSGTLSGSPPRRITSYDGSTKKVILSSGFTSTPADGVTFKIFME